MAKIKGFEGPRYKDEVYGDEESIHFLNTISTSTNTLICQCLECKMVFEWCHKNKVSWMGDRTPIQLTEKVICPWCKGRRRRKNAK